MDSVIAIFSQLGADSSIVFQFAIFVTTFLLAKLLFFNHLQKVLETRTEKTVGLEDSAEAKFEEINRMSKEYKEKISEANKEAKSTLDTHKTEIIKTEEKRYRDYEQEVNAEVDQARKKVESEISEKKEQIMNEAESLATSLVNQITRG
jgi:F0F1-type ATP synthase membrane subunit b/b'